MAKNAAKNQPLTQPLTLSRLNEVKEKMDSYVCSVTYDKTLENPPAFALIRNGLVGEIYKLFISNKFSDLSDFLYMHECGHIIFNHCDNGEKKALGVSARIRSQFEKYKEWFDNEESFFDYFKGYIFNVVDDFEVNSKLFTKEEFDAACASMESVGWGRGMWPEDYGFPVGKTWREYLTYVLNNMEQFLKDSKNQMDAQQQKNGQGQGKQGKGNGNQSSNGKSQGQQSQKKQSQGSGDGGSQQSKAEMAAGGTNHFSKEQMDQMRKQVADRDRSNLEKTAAEIEKNVQDQLAGDSENSSSSKNRGDSHECEEGIAAKTRGWDALKKALMKEVFNRVNVQTRRDQMYNANRRKLGSSNVIIPRNLTRTEFRADDFYVLLDVSGSVEHEIIMNTTKMFNDFANEFGKNSRLIMWDTSLCFDEKFKNIKDTCMFGGGTDMASGIRYIASQYGVRNQKLFILSDFCDNLDAWESAIKEFHLTNVYGICWDENERWEKDFESNFKKLWTFDLLAA